MKKTKKTFKIITTSISYLFFAIVFFIFANSVISLCMGKIPSVFNCNFFIVQTESMEPVIEPNDLVVSKISKIEDVEKGDIITFLCTDSSLPVCGQVITHRVEEVNKENGVVVSLVTKGDNNNACDAKLVTSDNFMGIVVYYSSGIGKFISVMTTGNKAFIFILIIAVAGFIMIAEFKKIMEAKNEKSKEDKAKVLKDSLREELLKEVLEEVKEELKNGKSE